jgi:hypothetical protein
LARFIAILSWSWNGIVLEWDRLGMGSSWDRIFRDAQV